MFCQAPDDTLVKSSLITNFWDLSAVPDDLFSNPTVLVPPSIYSIVLKIISPYF